MQTSDSGFVRYLQGFIPGADTISLQEVVKAFVPTKFKKNEYLVKEGEVCRYFCYIENGILQHSITVDGLEKTTYLALRDSATSSLHSFLNESPSRKDVKAISACLLWTVDLETFKELLEKNRMFEQFYHNLLERQICLIDDYRIDLLTMTPEERYRKLLMTEPKLLQQVPLHYLASFLGISQRHMSRIRKNIN